MPREPALLDADTIARYRPGVAVAVQMGAAADLPRVRPLSYSARAALPGGRPGVAPVTAGPSAARCALIEIRGVLTQRDSLWDCGESRGYDGIAAEYCEAHADPGVDRLVVDMDSRGGDIAGGEAGIEAMRAAKLASGKPVIGFVGACAASMAVWILSGVCDAIVIRADAWMGSIGAVSICGTNEEKNAKDGRKVHVFRSVPGKYNPNPDEALDALGASRLQSMADVNGARFTLAMVAFRELSEDVITGWNGEMFQGAAAVAAGLADMIGSLEDADAFAASLVGMKEAA